VDTQHILLTYIADLLVRHTGSGDASRTDRALRGAAGERPPVQSAVDVGAVLSFVDNVPDGQRDDVLNSVQLAQRAATGSFDRHTETEPWYEKFAEVLQRVGWVVEQFAFVKHQQSTGDLRLDQSALAILSAIASENALGVLTKSIGALRKLGDGAHQITIFNSAASREKSGNFQLGAVEVGKNGALSMALGAFYFHANDSRTKMLFATWGANDVELWTGAQRMTLNQEQYALARDAVRAKLGNPADYIADLGPV
jgi:hypothetical protein